MAGEDSRLPIAPDFVRLDADAVSSAEQRDRIMLAIGHLVFAWSNNESVFIYALMELLDTDFSSAATTFVSLNTTRARLDLIRRLGKLRIRDPKLLRRLERLIERFNDCTKVRNEFNHCIYELNPQGEITHTTTLRITEKKEGIQIAEVKPFDAARHEQIYRVIRKLTALNRDVWAFLPELEAHLKGSSASEAEMPERPERA